MAVDKLDAMASLAKGEKPKVQSPKVRANFNRAVNPTTTGQTTAYSNGGKTTDVMDTKTDKMYRNTRSRPKGVPKRAPSASGKAPGMLNTDVKNYAAEQRAARNARMIQSAKAGALKGLRGNLIAAPLGAAIGVAIGQGSRTPTTKGQMGRKRK